MKGLIKKIKLIQSAINLKFKQCINASIWPGVVILVSYIFAVYFIIPKFTPVTGDELWCKLIIGFVISFTITLYKGELKKLVVGGVGSLAAAKSEAKLAQPSLASQFFSFIQNLLAKASNLGRLIKAGLSKVEFQKLIINFISYITISIIVYYIMWNIKIFIYFLVFLATLMYISDNFKLSKINFIKNLQIFVFINCILALIGFCLYLFDVSIFNTVFCDSDSESDTEDKDVNKNEKNNSHKEEIIKNKEESLKNKDIVHVTSSIDDSNENYYHAKVNKDTMDNAIGKGIGLLEKVASTNIPDLGIAAAAAKVAADAIKHTPNMAPLPRLAFIGGAALVTAAGTKIGIELTRVSKDNENIENEIDTEGGISPSDTDGGFIHSVLENNEIPLIVMVNGLSYLNYIELSLILSLFSLLFRKYLIGKIKIFILNLNNKYFQNIKDENIKDENVSLNKAFETVDKYADYLILFIFICLFWIMFINIYFSSNLAENIDSFVKVYNHLKKQ